jgi:glycine betaine/choline ABC-type transport system substrate-binding protein
VSAKLTNEALQDMNGDVDLRGRDPRDVAAEFLQEHDLP